MKTLGTKIENDLAEKFRDVCNKYGKSVSEEIRDLIKFSIQSSDEDKETTELRREIMTNLPKADEVSYESEDDGTPRRAEIVWFTEEERNEIEKTT